MKTFAEFSKDPELMARYRDWADLPMTKQMLSLAHEVFGPQGLPPDRRTPEQALYYAGQVDVAEQENVFLGNLEMFVKQQEAMQEAALLTPDYGASRRLAAANTGEGDPT